MSLIVGIVVNRMIPALGILYTGAGHNLVRIELLPLQLLARINPIADPGLTAETQQTVNVHGAILLQVQLRYLRVRVWFRVAPGLEISVLLGAPFMDRFSKGIFPPEREVVPQQLRPEDINQRSPTRIVMTIRHKQCETDADTSDKEPKADTCQQ